MSKKSLKYIFFVTGLFFLYLLTVGKGFVDLRDKLTFSVFSEESSKAKTNTSVFKQLEISNVAAVEDNLDLSAVIIQVISFNHTLTYFPEGHISVLFEPKGVLPINNVFKLELSNKLGVFPTLPTSPIVIATEEEFFTPVLNGKIPAGTEDGNNYKLRISYGPESGPRLSYELPNAIRISSTIPTFLTPIVNVSATAEGVDFRCLDNPNTTTNPNYHFGSVEQGSSAVLLNDLNP